MTPLQLEPSAHAPWTSTMFGRAFISVVPSRSGLTAILRSQTEAGYPQHYCTLRMPVARSAGRYLHQEVRAAGRHVAADPVRADPEQPGGRPPRARPWSPGRPAAAGETSGRRSADLDRPRPAGMPRPRSLLSLETA